MIMNVYVYNL